MDERCEDTPQCTNAPMMTVATDSRLVKICGVFYNTWHALLTDKLGNSDTVAWFGKISAKRKDNKKSEKYSYIYMKMQI